MFGIKTQNLVRDIETGRYLENFFVSAIFSIVLIRVYLHLFDYPSIGGGDVHIAHMLFGGIFMLVAFIPLLTFLNREIKHFSSILGGVGFGMFIDELGKFITKDNDYFYQPTIAILYVIFVILFLIFKAIEKKIKVTPTEYAINALDFTKEAILHDFDIQEKKLTLKLIKQSKLDDPILNMLRQVLINTRALPLEETSILIKIRMFLRIVYKWLIQNRFLAKTVMVVFSIKIFINFISLTISATKAGTFYEYGELSATVLSAGLVIFAFYFLKRGKRLKAFELLKLAVFSSIFLRQFFVFYREQLSALLGLSFDIILLSMLQYIIQLETLKFGRHKDDPLQEMRDILYAGKA